MNNIFLADIFDKFEPGAIGWAVLGLVAALSVAVLVLKGLNEAKRFFGRQPTFDEIIKTLLPLEDFLTYKEEQRLRHVGIEKQISEARHSFDERSNSDLVRNGKQFETIFRLIGERDEANREFLATLSRLEERTETHVREFDSIKGQIERMLRDRIHHGRRDEN